MFCRLGKHVLDVIPSKYASNYVQKGCAVQYQGITLKDQNHL